MATMYVTCPKCGNEIEVEMEFHAGEWDTNTPETWEAGSFTRFCNCLLTTEEEDAVAVAAERGAMADPEFGVHYPEPIDEE